ncbi:MAG: hypothetical protein ACO3A2_01895 [Bdellovibrionia bacterium]
MRIASALFVGWIGLPLFCVPLQADSKKQLPQPQAKRAPAQEAALDSVSKSGLLEEKKSASEAAQKPFSPGSSSSSSSKDAEPPVYGVLVLPKPKAGKKVEVISDLTFAQASHISIVWEKGTNQKRQRVAQIHGSFPRNSGRKLISPDFPNALVWDKDPNSSHFTLSVPIQGSRILVSFQSEDAQGKQEHQQVVLKIKYEDPNQKKIPWWGEGLQASMGFFSYSYAERFRVQTVSYSLSQLMLAVSASGAVKFGAWDLRASAFFTPMSLSYNLTAEPAVSSVFDTRVLNGSLSLGYTLPRVAPPWYVRAALGAFYSTLMVGSGRYGYSNAFGPEVSTTLQKRLNSKSLGYFYFKLAPLLITGKGLGFGDRNLTLGLGYLQHVGKMHPLSVGIEFSSFLAEVPFTSRSVGEDTQSLSSSLLGLVLSYGF